MAQEDGISRLATAQKPVRLAAVVRTDLPLLEHLVRAYYAEDGHTFNEDRQLPALAALAAGEAFGRAWPIRLGARSVGYAVLAFSFSVEAGGREACIDELYVLPEVRKRGIGRRVLALLEAEARAGRAPGVSRGREPQPGDRPVSPRRLCRPRPFSDVQAPRPMSRRPRTDPARLPAPGTTTAPLAAARGS
jgi:GNAT superfamily N-acetyltransferase